MSRFTIGIILLFTTAALVFFLILPQWQKIAGTRAEISRLQSLHEELLALAEERDQLTQQYNGISETDLQKLQSIAPAGSETGSALIDFEALAVKDGMYLSRIDFTGTAPQGSLVPKSARAITPLPVSLTVRGSYDALRSFLKNTEHMLRIFDVGDISFGAGTGDQIDVSLKGSVYYRP